MLLSSEKISYRIFLTKYFHLFMKEGFLYVLLNVIPFLFLSIENYFNYKIWSKLYNEVKNVSSFFYSNCVINAFIQKKNINDITPLVFNEIDRLIILSNKAHILQTNNYTVLS